MARILAGLERHPGRALLAAGALTLAALWPASRLVVSTELADLLPRHSRSASAYREFLAAFGGLEQVFVFVELSPPALEVAVPSVAGATPSLADEELVLEAGLRLCDRLQTSPLVSAVRCGIEEEDERFFRDRVAARALLLVPDDRLDEALSRLQPTAMHQRVRQLRRDLTMPAAAIKGVLARADPLGFLDLVPAASLAGAGPSIDPLTSTFVADGGRAALLIVRPKDKELDPAAGRRWLAWLDEAQARLHTDLSPRLRVRAIGGPIYAAWDEALVRRDVIRTVASSATICSVVLAVGFASAVVPLVAAFTLLISVVFLAACLAMGYGPINGASLGFAAVLFGLGIDFVIHLGTRLRAESQTTPVGALGRSWRSIGPALLASALTTSGGFFVLWFAEVRLLREVGVVVAIGVLAVLLVTFFTAGPALGYARRVRFSPAAHRLQRVVDGAVSFAQHRCAFVLLVAAVLASLSLVVVRNLRIDADASALRADGHPAAELEERLAGVFGIGSQTATLLIEGGTRDQAVERAQRGAAWLRGHFADIRIDNPADFLSTQQNLERRIGRLRAADLQTAAGRLEVELQAAGLSPAAFDGVLREWRSWLEGGALPLAWSELPDWISSGVADLPGRSLLALRVRGKSAIVLTEVQLRDLEIAVKGELSGEQREATAAFPLSPAVRWASASQLGEELRSLARADFVRLGAFGGLAVLTVVVGFLWRRPRRLVPAMLPVVLGTLYTMALWVAVGQPLGLLSLAAMPMLLGLGIDDGLHSALSGGSIGDAVRRAGVAMAMTSLTTAAGFGSLVFSAIPALRAVGLLVSTGTMVTLIVVLTVPAAWESTFSSGWRRKSNNR